MDSNTMSELSNLMENITLKDLVYFIVGVIGVISIIVEKSKSLPFHPWTHFIGWVGKCLTKDIVDRLEKVEEQQKANNEAIIELDKKVDKKFEEKQKDDDEKEAKRLRARIIEFADSCRVGNHHTQNHFENVFRDYSDYIDYCESHDIPNHFIDTEYEYIKEVYSECLRENKFL